LLIIHTAFSVLEDNI